MSSLTIAAIVFACLAGGALLGFLIRQILPEHHLSSESRDAIKLGTGLIGTMGALVLGLMVGSAKGSYDSQKAGLTQLSAKIILLDRALAHYGPETKEAREQLKQAAERMLDQFWHDGSQATPKFTASGSNEKLYDMLHDLTPKTDAQKTIQSQAISMAVDIGQSRWLLYQQGGSSISTAFLTILIIWLTIIFMSFGLLAPRNLTVIVTLVLCAFSVAGAVFLILELDRPFSGAIQIPKQTLLSALEQLGR